MSSRRYLSAIALLTLLPLSANAGSRPTAKDEAQVKPACVGIVDNKAWADCMARFKDVRPQHPPTKLMFDDWRNP